MPSRQTHARIKRLYHVQTSHSREETRFQQLEHYEVSVNTPDNARVIAQATTFLRRDPLRNIVALKMLQSYSADIRCWYTEQGDSTGVLLRLPTALSPFDATYYPNTSEVVLLNTQDATTALRLLKYIPTDTHLVFKTSAAHEQALVSRHFGAQRTTAFLSYTWNNATPRRRHEDVRVSDQIDQTTLDLILQRGHDRDEIQQLFANGNAFCCTYYRGQQALGACMAFVNFEHIWEIGALFVVPEARRQGIARQLVETTLHEFEARKLVPRYVTQEDNHASQQLAESLGLHMFTATTHSVC